MGCSNLSDTDIIVYNRHPLYSNIAYGIASGSSENELPELNNFFASKVQEARPDIAIIIDLPARIAFERINRRGEALTKVEENGVDFIERVRRVYLDMHEPELRVIETLPTSAMPLDASTVAEKVWSLVSEVWICNR